MNSSKDAYGQELMNHLRTGSGYEIVERNDGYIDTSGGTKIYFSEYKDWPEHEKKAINYVQGRIIDIGCGAGRHSLYLQKKGFDVVGIDKSPLAVKVCEARGLKQVRNISITQLNRKLGVFDTIIMFGNNFGLFANRKRAKWLLKKFYNMTSFKGKIIAESRDPYATELREHLDYHKLNRKRGRMSGRVKIRVRFRKYIGEWFEYLLVSKDEMKELLADTGWEIEKFIDGNNGSYIGIIKKVIK